MVDFHTKHLSVGDNRFLGETKVNF